MENFEVVLRALMRGLEYPELAAMYLVYMRRLIIPEAAGVMGIEKGRMRVFERRLREKVFPGLTLKEARGAVAALYKGLSQSGRDAIVRHLTDQMPSASQRPQAILAFHRSRGV